LCHNIDFHEKWLFADLLTKSMLKRSDSVIVLSENVYKSAVKFNHKNVVTLFHPSYKVSSETIEKSISFDYLKILHKPTVLFFGFIKPYKGLDVLAKAVPVVKEALPDVQFVVAGEAYSQLTIDNGQLIIHNKYVPMSEAVHYFNIADVVVVPYRTATQSGIVQLAYSFGKPVIASDIDGLREMVLENETGLVFMNGDHGDLADKIVGFYEGLSRVDYKEKIRLFNENYSWTRFVEMMVKGVCI
jgi:glycosyltransferase involved in cell wall biosynthesis